jgi:micrococcal nuclease
MELYWYKALISRIVDGDTVEADVDLGFRIRQKMMLRLYGIDAPELIAQNPEPGRKAKEFLAKLVEGKEIVIQTFKDKGDKYGRMLAELYVVPVDKTDKVSVNRIMVDAGYAVIYLGGPK